MLTNTRLEDQVIATLDWDRRIAESSEIAVSADGGTVTLRGSVESIGQRRAAAQDARKIVASTRSTTSSRSASWELTGATTTGFAAWRCRP